MAYNTRPVNRSVPRQDAATLWQMQRDRDAWRERALVAEERVAVLLQRIERNVAHAHAILRGEQATWWQKQGRLLPPGPAEVQERMQQQYAERQAAVSAQFARSLEHASGDLERARRTAYEVIQTDKLE